jgi:hypothetical protein
MWRNIAIAFGALLIAAAIMITNHWTINTTADGLLVAARLNRWTGQIEICAINPKTITGTDVAGAKLDCSR